MAGMQCSIGQQGMAWHGMAHHSTARHDTTGRLEQPSQMHCFYRVAAANIYYNLAGITC